eukprot:scpid90009/ scgid3725/ 
MAQHPRDYDKGPMAAIMADDQVQFSQRFHKAKPFVWGFILGIVGILTVYLLIVWIVFSDLLSFHLCIAVGTGFIVPYVVLIFKWRNPPWLEQFQGKQGDVERRLEVHVNDSDADEIPLALKTLPRSSVYMYIGGVSDSNTASIPEYYLG